MATSNGANSRAISPDSTSELHEARDTHGGNGADSNMDKQDAYAWQDRPIPNTPGVSAASNPTVAADTPDATAIPLSDGVQPDAAAESAKALSEVEAAIKLRLDPMIPPTPKTPPISCPKAADNDFRATTILILEDQRDVEVSEDETLREHELAQLSGESADRLAAKDAREETLQGLQADIKREKQEADEKNDAANATLRKYDIDVQAEEFTPTKNDGDRAPEAASLAPDGDATAASDNAGDATADGAPSPEPVGSIIDEQSEHHARKIDRLLKQLKRMNGYSYATSAVFGVACIGTLTSFVNVATLKYYGIRTTFEILALLVSAILGIACTMYVKSLTTNLAVQRAEQDYGDRLRGYRPPTTSLLPMLCSIVTCYLAAEAYGLGSLLEYTGGRLHGLAAYAAGAVMAPIFTLSLLAISWSNAYELEKHNLLQLSEPAVAEQSAPTAETTSTEVVAPIPTVVIAVQTEEQSSKIEPSNPDILAALQLKAEASRLYESVRAKNAEIPNIKQCIADLKKWPLRNRELVRKRIQHRRRIAQIRTGIQNILRGDMNGVNAEYKTAMAVPIVTDTEIEAELCLEGNISYSRATL